MKPKIHLSYKEYKSKITNSTKNRIIKRLLPTTYMDIFVFPPNKTTQILEKIGHIIYFEYVLLKLYISRLTNFLNSFGKCKKRFCALKGFDSKQYYDIIFFLNMNRRDYMLWSVPIIEKLTEIKKGIKILIITPEKIFENFKEISTLNSYKNIDFVTYNINLFKLSLKDYLILKKKSRKLKHEISTIINNHVELSWKMHIKETFYNRIDDYLFLERVYIELFKKIKGNKIVYLHLISEPALIGILSKKDIEKVVIQHGAISAKSDWSIFEGADEVILWGEYWRKNIKNKIPSNTKTVICGCPKTDFLPKNYMDFENHYEKNNILVVSQTHHPNKELVRKFLAFIEQLVIEMNENVKITIKLHPSENKKLYKRFWNKEIFENVNFIQDTNLYNLIKKTDVVVDTTSTALLEAMLFNKPIIQIRCEPSETEWHKHGILSVVDKKDFINKIKLLLDDHKYRKKVINNQKLFKKHCFSNIGTSTYEIARYLANCCSDGENGQKEHRREESL